MAVAAARRAITDAEMAERELVAGADQRIAWCVAAFKGEALKVAQIAELLTLTAGEVRRSLRGPRW